MDPILLIGDKNDCGDTVPWSNEICDTISGFKDGNWNAPASADDGEIIWDPISRSIDCASNELVAGYGVFNKTINTLDIRKTITVDYFTWWFNHWFGSFR